MKAYRKRYWPLALWCIALVPVMMLGFYGAQWLGLDELASTAVMMLSMNLALDGLFVLIWAGEYVYWINGGPDYEGAKAAAREARRLCMGTPSLYAEGNGGIGAADGYDVRTSGYGDCHGCAADDLHRYFGIFYDENQME